MQQEQPKESVWYKGFEIRPWGAFWTIKGKPGIYTWLRDAKAFIDWLSEKLHHKIINP